MLLEASWHQWESARRRRARVGVRGRGLPSAGQALEAVGRTAYWAGGVRGVEIATVVGLLGAMVSSAALRLILRPV
jgi:hypothetical protein